MPKFVYIQGPFGNVESQIWHDESVVKNGSGKDKDVKVLQEHNLEDWEAHTLTVSELEAHYPYKEKPNA